MLTVSGSQGGLRLAQQEDRSQTHKECWGWRSDPLTENENTKANPLISGFLIDFSVISKSG